MAAVTGFFPVFSSTNTVENKLFHGLRYQMKGFNLSSSARARTRTLPSSLKEASLVHGSDRPELKKVSPSSLKEASLVDGSHRPELKKVLTEGDARSSLVLEDEVMTPLNFKDYLERYRDFTESGDGPPRWFTPLECGAPMKNAPLLLFLPGEDGLGHGLMRHHRRLGKIFEVWCLHIPVSDRTPFEGLVKIVEMMIKSENSCFTKRPIFLVGDSLGGCVALAVAARNSKADLTLILANPASCFCRSQLKYLLPFLDAMPDHVLDLIPYLKSLNIGDPVGMAMKNVEMGVTLGVGQISQSLSALFADLLNLRVLLSRETILWKIRLLMSASSYANSRLHAIKSEVLVLASGNDQLLPNQDEAERLCRVLPNCRFRHFPDSHRLIFLEGDVDLVTIIKGTGIYRRSTHKDWALDFLPPTLNEFKYAYEVLRWVIHATDPVVFSTMEDGKIVRGLAGIPQDGPVILVGYHMFMGWDLGPFVGELLMERGVFVRGLAHPFMFDKHAETLMPDPASFDFMRIMGAVPVSATNFYKLLSSKSFVLLYPGGAREALHRKGEEYKLFWPEHSEFIRMAASFGATIIPFGAVGEDDVAELLLDYDDLIKIPYIRDQIEDLNRDGIRLRTGVPGEVGNQDLYLPGMFPKIPGRFYCLFGGPIQTKGMKNELKDKAKAHAMYLQVKSKVEKLIAYLKEKRELDPYRGLLPRLLYQATHGFTSKVPTFEL
ncbi:acyltransferase-like protein At1g54570, chloroplastic isoform X1 [Amborella trichopoda]|nr:acyltransferase-like protein At1g54570, chloroplastic isoform X1 [Amborella trichopoda]|eukprot:XP_020522953.1 acyltransferase-like protein At1g54570, chloroplastic isoform X1 [Amborella trichopoda]